MGEQAQARPTMADQLADTQAPSRNGTEPLSEGLRDRLSQGTFTTARSLELLLSCEDEDLVELLLTLVAHPDHGPAMLYHPPIARRLAAIRQTQVPLYLGVLLPGLRQLRIYVPDLERRLESTALAPQGALTPPETLTELLAADIPAPVQLFEGLMHEGMLLFGGKSKRGKSWLMYDLAIALAVGRSAFRHFTCPAPQPVLYLALEDGRARLQRRAKAIQANLVRVDRLHLRYTFPGFADNGIALLAEEIRRHGYRLVIIDVLAKLETAGRNGEKHYHEVYEMFAPLQALRQEQPFCVAMLTHLRKQEAEDVFDALHGSVAYQGAQDVLWVLERKPKDDFAFLHIRDKDAEDMTIALRFHEGHWEYVGEGEEYELTRDQRKVIKVLAEEKGEMTIQAIMKAADFPEAKYAYVRKLLMTMVADDLIHRARQGRYSATLRAIHEMLPSEDNDDLL